MKVFAISDLHLAFQVDKPMDVFGAHWKDHPRRIREAWMDTVGPDDLVLIPGDLSWGMRFEEVEEDMAFLDGLPGTKVIIRGNHDYWWASLAKVRKFLPESIIPLQNSAYVHGNVAVAGTRLWIDPALNLEPLSDQDRKIFSREVGRLNLSLDQMPRGAKHRILMTHYPPIALDGRPGQAVAAAAGRCDIWVFGHMHLGNQDYDGFNRRLDDIRFEFVSADYLQFVPRLILDTDA